MDLSAVVLPDVDCTEFVTRIREAEDHGIERVWTFDHLAWSPQRDQDWFSMVPMLAAAFVSTTTVRLGPLVATPNFRHPVPFAKEIVTLDRMSHGRFELGIGAGTEGDDSYVLGEPAWSRKERTARFGEWTTVLLGALEEDRFSADGCYYSAHAARLLPACVQRPRVPVTVAATGPAGMRIAARHADRWVTNGAPGPVEDLESWLGTVCEHVRRFGAVAAEHAPGRRIRRTVLVGLANRSPLQSVQCYDDVVGRLEEAGVDDVCLPWPRTDGAGIPRAMLDEILGRHCPGHRAGAR
nr:LLM class flavin-dependent oxidoreductase [Pseudonocardia sp. C8]